VLEVFMKIQNKMGGRFEAELWRDDKLVADKPEKHKFLIVKENEIIKIGLKRSLNNEK